MTFDDEKILSLVEQDHLSGKPLRHEPAWIRYADLFIEKRLSVSGMVRILNESGYVISRQGVNDWLLRNKYEETSYLRKTKRKSVLDPAKKHDTVVNNLKDNKSNRIHDCDVISGDQRVDVVNGNGKINEISTQETAVQTNAVSPVKANAEADLDRMLKLIDQSVERRSKF